MTKLLQVPVRDRSPASNKVDASTIRTSSSIHKPPSRSPSTSKRRAITEPTSSDEFELDEDLIFARTQEYREFKFNGATLTNLPKYNDSTPYNITEDDEKYLLKGEIARLVKDTVLVTELLFDSQGHVDFTDAAGFDDISNVATQIICNLGIVRLDNSRLALAHCKNEIGESAEIFNTSQRMLVNTFSYDQTQVRGAEPKLLDPSGRNTFVYHALVDYATSTVARLLMRIAKSTIWNEALIACLAESAVKLKILAEDPKLFAERSIRGAEHAAEVMKEKTDSRDLTIFSIDVTDEKKARIESYITDTDASQLYHECKWIISKLLSHLIKCTLVNLKVSTRHPSTANNFQCYSGVHEPGVHGIPTAVNKSRLGELYVSQDTFVINCAYTAINLVTLNIDRIAQLIEVTPPSSKVPVGQDTSIEFFRRSLKDDVSPPIRFKTSSIDHVISIVVPLSLSNGFVSNTLSRLVTYLSSITANDDRVIRYRPHLRYEIEAITVSSAEWSRQESKMVEDHMDEEIRTFVKSPLCYNFQNNTVPDHGPGSREKLAIQPQMQEVIQRYLKEKPRMDRWFIDQNSIRISCRLYVANVILLAFFIICGGIVVPFLVGEKIMGVDPFQITTYSWLVAAFIVLIAQSRYVSVWPWHDFIHGRVVCHSISDVCEVTGMPAQVVIMYLLLEEWATVLQTRGSFNGMFKRKVEDTSGFAIDKAVHISTLFASGFVVVKVFETMGEHLVCLDARRTSHRLLLDTRMTCLACVDLEKYDESSDHLPGDSKTGSAQNRGMVKQLKKSKVDIERIMGIYISDSYFG